MRHLSLKYLRHLPQRIASEQAKPIPMPRERQQDRKAGEHTLGRDLFGRMWCVVVLGSVAAAVSVGLCCAAAIAVRSAVAWRQLLCRPCAITGSSVRSKTLISPAPNIELIA